MSIDRTYRQLLRVNLILRKEWPRPYITESVVTFLFNTLKSCAFYILKILRLSCNSNSMKIMIIK